MLMKHGFRASTGRVLKNDSYKINKVGVKEEPSDIVLEAVNLYSKNNGATEIQKGVAIANGMALTRELGDSAAKHLYANLHC